MVAKLIDGKKLAADMRHKIAQHVQELRTKYRIAPTLAVILIGDDPASQVYVNAKTRYCREVGINSFAYRLAADTPESEVVDVLHDINWSLKIHGILLQLPLPKHLSADKLMHFIKPEKDVDGFHINNVGKLSSDYQVRIIPCTPLGCLLLLRNLHKQGLDGMNAVIVGRSNIVGKPLAQLLLKENCTVTIAHSRSDNLPSLTANADIVVAAAGQPQMIKDSWIKPGATVIDVGINRIEMPDGSQKLVGDVDFESVKEIAGAITPVPGGVGPMTIACLLANVVRIFEDLNEVDGTSRLRLV
ncbi:MAG: bifunctional methylenetetrahydrofolate dehydrogenase/methenyltetrahydrofolate cyclohydrolase FolD [Aestuariivita sp.]|nr:bifunctional methylenetetrahydrofolate dehydrogenase/methenyltetrahydrofolate cyclohydrolase FolD [Aestuariivita sp.]MCY4203636.1 bifunctional methylenetetrahydrofolate dehydrogenase/methenyltetrahydrofolate cyclohydrolase FolD [Aestuariivita sp.]MCY4288715.1 bifunctional methylenetetrahydrofolate dehydrogenase/methenyltetrahydrofolate cyclohydrolase FolD [Aestuariivita sp.]MCY4347830.1 bifunctional methylenetetrahydrofolate dehydrogenase/methenyltetrahydrofolate cyclohydrolase FolD [Aestuari